MRSFDSKHGYDNGGALEQIVARVQDIKASHTTGKQCLVVRERGKNLTHATIDIDMKVSKDLKAKETYVFQVREKDDSRNPGWQRKRSAEFKAFDCQEKPEEFSISYVREMQFNRFGGANSTSGARRTKF